MYKTSSASTYLLQKVWCALIADWLVPEFHLGKVAYHFEFVS